MWEIKSWPAILAILVFVVAFGALNVFEFGRLD